MADERKRPGVAFWITAALMAMLVFVGYPFAWGQWIQFKFAKKPPAAICAAGDMSFAPLSWLRGCGVLPEFYVHYIDKSITSGMRFRHGPIR